ncbi:Serine rich endogenous peptide 14 [Cardamine amara subsp. amara]|uniref:Serine rich endogenous peptide 14 n=1 Tax=Cardamine amara subsp. amara TaxID=228776 RepID=A0ABD0ZP39_CARAN
MAPKTSNLVALLLSFFLLFVSSQVVVADAKRHQLNKLRLDCVSFPYPPPPPPVAPPIYVPPSRSPKGKGP